MTCRAKSMVMLVAMCAVHLPSAAMAEKIPADIRVLVEQYAKANHVPPELAHAIVMVESRYNPRARGSGVLGLMQIKYQTAVGLGYTGSPDGLLDPETNIKYGMRYLAGAHRRAGGDVCQTVVKYSGGWRATRMNAGQARYCGKAKGFIATASAYGVGSGRGGPRIVPDAQPEVILASAEPRKIGLEKGLTQANVFAHNKKEESESLAGPVLGYAPVQLENPFEEALPMQPAQRIELGFWSPEADILAAPVITPETAASLADTTARIAAATGGAGIEPDDAETEAESVSDRVAIGHSVFETTGLRVSPATALIP